MKNVLGTDLKCCGTKPLTGYFRDGFCRTTESDQGRHVVASVVDEKFLVFSRQMGNDLSTPNPMYNFPGLKPGDKWCVCALRWKEAFEAGREEGKQETLLSKSEEIQKLRAEQVKAEERSFDKGKGKGTMEALEGMIEGCKLAATMSSPIWLGVEEKGQKQEKGNVRLKNS